MSVYERFDAATNANHINAYAVLYNGVCIGRVVFKDGATCRCFAQVWGVEMAEASVSGHGFDRKTDAFSKAVERIDNGDTKDPASLKHLAKWCELAAQDTGEHWDNRLIGAGYVVQHVI